MTIKPNQNQAHLLLIATELTKIGGLTIGHMPVVRSLTKKLSALVKDRTHYIVAKPKLFTLDLDEKEEPLLRSLWGGFDMGMVPRSEDMLDLIDSVGKLLGAKE